MTKKKQDTVVGQQDDGVQLELEIFAGVQFIITDGRLDTRMIYNNITPELIILAGSLLDKLGTRMINQGWSHQQAVEMQKKAEMDQILKSLAGQDIKRA